MQLEVAERPTAQQLMLQLEELSERGRYRPHAGTTRAAAVAAAVLARGSAGSMSPGAGRASPGGSLSPGGGSKSPGGGSGSPAATWTRS